MALHTFAAPAASALDPGEDPERARAHRCLGRAPPPARDISASRSTYFNGDLIDMKRLTSSSLRAGLLAVLLAGGAANAQVIGGGDNGPAFGHVNAKVNVGALADRYQYDAIIVGYRQGDVRNSGNAGEAMAAVSQHLDAVAARTGHALGHERMLSTGGHVVRINRKLDDAKLVDLMNEIALDPNVEYVEPDQIMEAFLTPNDPSYSQQWHYFEATGGANLPQAWDQNTGTGVVVAILDTGQTAHPDLDANTVAGYDFVSSATNARDGNGRDSNPQDQGDWTTAGQCGTGSQASNSSWHGTHVAGTVAAVTNNATGVAGVAFGAKLQHVRVLAACGGTLSDIADAITWASGGTVSGIPANATPAKVINMSLGGSSSTCASTYQNAINGAVGRGTVVIVAAGNSNTNSANATPANCSNVVTVAATNRSGGRAYYSNFGTNVDVAAPGGDVRTSSSNGILSTLNSGTTTPASASYAWYQGTSMATPHVAGLAALMLSKSSSLTPATIESTLKANARAFPVSCSGCGTGIINALATLNAIGGGTTPTTYSISGTITTSTGTALSGVTVSRGAASTTTNSSGVYTFTGLANGSYTITPSLSGYTFSPTSRSVSVSGANVTGQNFTGTASGGGGSSALSNGVGRAGSTNSTSANSDFDEYTVAIPSGASNLVIATSGASGDVDLYVRFGAAPSTSTYDCRPYTGSGNESCSFATPSTGTYYVRVYGYQTGTVNYTVTATWSTGGGGGGSVVERLSNGNFDSITSSTNTAPDGTWRRTAFSGSSFNTLLAGQSNAHSGSAYAYLGVNNSASQTVESGTATIPSTATTATLSFQTSIVTSETTTSRAYDTLRVQLVDAGTNSVLATLVTLSNLNKTSSASTYVLRSYNVASYKGRNVKVRLVATNDSSLQTTFRVDSVSLQSN
jgi:serine protease